jgi:hypothetical protein
MSSRNTQWDNLQQTGEGTWTYNQDNLSYDIAVDPLTELSVRYNGLGTLTEWTNLDLL